MPPSEHHHPVIFVFLNQCPGSDLHQNTDYTVILENRGEHVHAGEFMRKVKNIIFSNQTSLKSAMSLRKSSKSCFCFCNLMLQIHLKNHAAHYFATIYLHILYN